MGGRVTVQHAGVTIDARECEKSVEGHARREYHGVAPAPGDAGVPDRRPSRATVEVSGGAAQRQRPDRRAARTAYGQRRRRTAPAARPPTQPREPLRVSGGAATGDRDISAWPDAAL